MNHFDIFGNPENPRLLAGRQYKEPGQYEVAIPETELAVETDIPPQRRFPSLIVLLTVITSLLVFQCYKLQIDENQANAALSEDNSLRYITLPADRGLITDYSGTVIAQNSRKEALSLDPRALPGKKEEREAIYTLLASKTGLNQNIFANIEKYRLETAGGMVVKADLSKEESLLYKEWFANLPGVSVTEAPIRLYNNIASLGHLVGYVGLANDGEITDGAKANQIIGKDGLEQSYDQALHGQPGIQKAEVDAYGEVARILPSDGNDQPTTGSTLRLSIDSKLQTIVANALRDELERRRQRLGKLDDYGATAVVVDTATGAIKAMVSLPDYDNNLFAKGISQSAYVALLNNPAKPLLNRAIQGNYPPGSTIKPLLASAALQEKIISANTEMFTPISINIGEFRFPDWKFHGQTNTRKAIAESNDIFFYAVGGGWEEKNFRGLGMERMNKYLSQFGFGEAMGIDIAGENTGLLPDDEWKRANFDEQWYIGDTYHSSIGQGFTLTTPLQMAMSTAAIANGGTVWRPSLVWSLINPTTGQEELLPHISMASQFVEPSHLQVVREGMRQAVQSGSARPLNTLKVASAGKTGTAEFGDKGLTHAWYTGFAPYENPEIAFAILIEAGGDSYQSSVPVAEQILRDYYGDPLLPGQKLNSQPNLSNPEFSGEH